MENRANNNQQGLKGFSADKLPPPEVLQEYERIIPGITKFLLETERRALNINNLKSFTGLIFGFLIGIFGMGGGFYLTLKGYNIIGVIFTSSTLVTLVMSFIYGSQSKRNGNHRIGEIQTKP
jgi:uncharacterized membrane protein